MIPPEFIDEVLSRVDIVEIIEPRVALKKSGYLQPPIMTQTFGLFSGNNALIYFPAAPSLLAGILTVLALVLFVRTTADLPVAQPAS